MAVWPAATVAVGVGAATAKSCPVPESDTVCGLPDALSVTVRVPVLLPLAAGSKNTPIEQLEPGETLLPQALSTPKSEGLTVTLVTERAAVPEFVSITVCGRPEVPTYWLGKLILSGARLTAGAGGVLPLNGIVCGLPGASSEMEIFAVRVPAAVGLKVTLS